MSRSFTKEEDALILKLAQEAEGRRPWKEWEPQFPGCTASQLKGRYYYLLRQNEEGQRQEAESQLAHIAPEFLDRKQVPPPDWRVVLDHAEEGQALEQEAEDKQRIATVRVPGPAILVYSADWHLGSLDMDYQAWREHIGLLMDSPGVYLVELGDERDNMRSFYDLEGVLSQVLSPKQQARMLEGLCMELCEKGKLLAKVEGNHDASFDERLFGEALNSYIYKNSTAPRFANRGLLKLIVTGGEGQEREFPHLLFHKSRYRSFLNALHGAKREYQLSFPAAVVAGAHDHHPGIEYYWHYQLARQAGYDLGGMTILIKTGTFSDRKYSWKYWGGGCLPVMPCVVFSGNGQMVAFPEMGQAIRYRQQLIKEG